MCRHKGVTKNIYIRIFLWMYFKLDFGKSFTYIPLYYILIYRRVLEYNIRKKYLIKEYIDEN